MPAPGTMRGLAARIVWQYHTAAELDGYTVAPDVLSPGTWTLTATATSQDAFVLKQTPLVFVAPTARGALVWPLDSVKVTEDGAVYGRLRRE